MPRRPAPTPLRLHPGPTPPRNFIKFTLPTMPQQSFYPTVVPSVQSLKQDEKYFTRRGHKRTSSSSSISSVDSDDSATSATATVPAANAVLPTARDIVALQHTVLVNTTVQLPKAMTRGPRQSYEGGGMAMPEYRRSSNSQDGMRKIEMMGPWEYSKLRLSEAEIAAMISPPKPVIANPCPVTW